MHRKRRSAERQLRRRFAVTLGGKQFALAVEPAGIAAERSVAADHAVARDQHRDMIVAIGRADRSDRLWLADRSRDLGITARFARRDLAELPPHGFLESSAGDIDRQLARRKRTSNRSQRALDQLTEAAGILRRSSHSGTTASTTLRCRRT